MLAIYTFFVFCLFDCADKNTSVTRSIAKRTEFNAVLRMKKFPHRFYKITVVLLIRHI